jgi:hypothetical protein
MEKIVFDKLLILSLFGAHIYEREDFEKPEKLLRLKDNLEQTDYLVTLSLDQEHNLYTLAVTDKDRKRHKRLSTMNSVVRKTIGNVFGFTAKIPHIMNMRFG